MRSERTKACSIDKATKIKVFQRDECQCVLCGSPKGLPEAHFIPRSQGGLGVEQNIVTLCRSCHRRYDWSSDRTKIQEILRSYLRSRYEDWDEDELVFKKYGGLL